ncbi:MAG TPA: hypothetical protein VFA90_10490 [Terriglobales bacterium]|nr:hypothetical protein [Terriglobales bacterium]
MSALRQCVSASILACLLPTLIARADDLHFKRNISIGGNSVSSSEVWVKGARERSAISTPAGNMVTLHQCDLKRTLTINDQSQSYFVLRDPQDDSTAKAAAMFGAPAPAPAPSSGGTITQTVTLTDTGERKQISGYTARHVKMMVTVNPSANACTQAQQKFDIDGWYADIKEQASCGASVPPIRQEGTCADHVVVVRKGTGRPGYPLVQTITMHNEDSSTTKINISTSDIEKNVLGPELFDVPDTYHEVKSISDLYSIPAAGQSPMNAISSGPQFGGANGQSMMAQAQQMAPMQQGMSSQFQGGMPGRPGMQAMGMQGASTGVGIPLPQALGPKAAGKIRIGIAPAQAQMGQGNNAQADYATPIRNAIIYMMNGPAVEIAALDARIPIQLQAEAQQKQCDFILMSSVTVKHGGGGFGKFMKAGNMAANMNPMVMMTKSVTTMAASQAAAQAAAMTAQQQAVNQLSQFNGQIKSKDDITVDYQLYPTGQGQPKLQNSLKGKAKSDGEDVLTPLIQQTATNVLTEVTKK